MELSTLRDLFIHELKDLYSAEKQLIKALPKVAKAATNSDLKAGIETHLDETVEHANRLEKILSGLGTSTRGPKCKGMEGLIEEGSHLIEEESDPEVLDAGIIGGSQKIEHYEIAGYGTARAFAELLGEEEAMELLQQTLDEEKATDQKLTELALAAVNVEALNDEDDDDSGAGKGEKSKGSKSGGSRAGKSSSRRLAA